MFISSNPDIRPKDVESADSGTKKSPLDELERDNHGFDTVSEQSGVTVVSVDPLPPKLDRPEVYRKTADPEADR